MIDLYRYIFNMTKYEVLLINNTYFIFDKGYNIIP